jgi:hypothetical protein
LHYLLKNSFKIFIDPFNSTKYYMRNHFNQDLSMFVDMLTVSTHQEVASDQEIAPLLGIKWKQMRMETMRKEVSDETITDDVRKKGKILKKSMTRMISM